MSSRSKLPCLKCGQLGHFQRKCKSLSFSTPASGVCGRVDAPASSGARLNVDMSQDCRNSALFGLLVGDSSRIDCTTLDLILWMLSMAQEDQSKLRQLLLLLKERFVDRSSLATAEIA